MKKTLILFSMFLPFIANAETYSCERLKGWQTDGLATERTLKEKLCDSPSKQEVMYENCTYYFDDETFNVICENKPVETCATVKNTIDEVVAICPGTIATGTYLISKDEHKIFYSKVGKIKNGYAQMFEAKCK